MLKRFPENIFTNQVTKIRNSFFSDEFVMSKSAKSAKKQERLFSKRQIWLSALLYILAEYARLFSTFCVFLGEKKHSMMDISQIPSPCYVMEEALFRQNLRLINSVKERAGVNIILAFKAFALWKDAGRLAVDHLPL